MMRVTRLFRRLFSGDDLDCRDTRQLGSDYLEDDLPPEKRSAIQTHLDRCGPCRAFIEGLSTTVAILARLPRTTPPPSFKRVVLDRTREAGRGH